MCVNPRYLRYKDMELLRDIIERKIGIKFKVIK
jgi:hypothetical protein